MKNGFLFFEKMTLKIKWQEDRNYGSGTLTGKVGEFNLFYIYERDDGNFVLYSVLKAFPMRTFRNWKYVSTKHVRKDELIKVAERMLESLINAAQQ